MRKLLISESRDVYYHLALEEFLVRHWDLSQDEILVVYINQPSIILGKNQNILREVHSSAFFDENIHLARRISGGGTVVHDIGNINFSFFHPYNFKKVNNYQSSVHWIAKCIQGLGIDCYTNERNAIFLSNHKKISGSAQFSTTNGILSHLTLLYNSNIEFVESCLSKNDFDFQTKASPSVPSVVTNLGDILTTSMDQFIAHIAQVWNPDSYVELIQDHCVKIDDLVRTKYKNYEYIYHTALSGKSLHRDGEIEWEKGKIIGTNIPNKSEIIGYDFNHEILAKLIN